MGVTAGPASFSVEGLDSDTCGEDGGPIEVCTVIDFGSASALACDVTVTFDVNDVSAGTVIIIKLEMASVKDVMCYSCW